nr:neutral zinc metallopeptidase [Geodermatophilus sabuli]
MPAVPSRRAAVALLATLVTIVLSGCTVVVAGRPISLQPPTGDVDAGEVVVEGATDDEIDVLARNALADLETFWTDQMPDVFGQPFEPLEGGYFSVDPGDPGAFPDGIGCGTDVAEVEGNAFYCSAPDAPNSDSISYDRTFLTELAEGYGRFIPALVMAHEFGHAVQARVGYPDFSISVETQADCFAGAWTSWVADGEAEFSTIRAPELDELLRGYVLLRDPPGTSATVDAAHGSFFDRVSAFQEGFESGPTACRDNFTAQRPYTQGRFLDPQDQASQGNASFDEAQRIAGTALPEFWTRAFSEVFGETFDPPALEPFAGDPPACAPDDERDLVYCPDDNLVAYDQRDLAGPVYEQFFDYAVVTALSLPYAQAARDQLGLSGDDADAVRSAVCLTGWFSAEFRDGELGATISPGDLDESVQFLLEYGRDPAVLPETQLSGFQLVDLFRNGFFQGPSACDVGV